MRSSYFVLAYSLCNLLVLAVTMLPILLVSTSANWLDSDMMQLFCFISLSPFILVLPGSSLFALGKDMHTGAIHNLLATTHLGAWDVVFGKWLSKIVEAQLMLCTLLPYSVLYYYKYGGSPIGHLLGATSLLLFTGGLCAICMALSTIQSIVFRVILLPFLVVPAILTAGAIFRGASEVDRYGLLSAFAYLPLVFLYTVFFILIPLVWAACSCAPSR